MSQYEGIKVEEAQKAFASMLEKSGKAKEKITCGTAQHTLLVNRMRALQIASALVRTNTAKESAGEADGCVRASASYSAQDLEAAHASLLSLISKSEKAQCKLAEGSWQHAMLERNLRALRMALPLIEQALKVNLAGSKGARQADGESS